MPSTLSAKRHRISRRDSISLQLEGGATATIPLASSLLHRPAGSLVVPLESPTLHRRVKITWRAVSADEAAAGAPPPRGAPPTLQPRRRITSAWLAPLGWLVPGGGRASSAALVTLAWLAGRWWPALVTAPLLEACAALPPLPLVPWVALPPLVTTPALLPPLLAALLVLLCAAARAFCAWRARANATWSFFLAPVPEAADAYRGGSPRAQRSPLIHGTSASGLYVPPLDTLPGNFTFTLTLTPALAPSLPLALALTPTPTLPGSGHSSAEHAFSPGLRSGSQQSLLSSAISEGGDGDSYLDEGEGEGDGDTYLEMDALLVIRAASEHSLIHSVSGLLAKASDQLINTSDSTADALRPEALFDACDGIARIYAACGPTLMLVVRNDQNNLAKARAALAIASDAEGGATLTVGELLRWEVEQQMHRCGASSEVVLADPSAAVALLWLRRSLAFMLGFMRHLQQGLHAFMDGTRDDIDGIAAFRAAYTDELQPYHKWLLRQTFSISISHAPGYTDFALAIGPGLGDAERDQVIDGEISALLRAGEPLVHALQASYAQLQMDDVRRA